MPAVNRVSGFSLKLCRGDCRISLPYDPRYEALCDLAGLVRHLGGRDPVADRAALRPRQVPASSRWIRRNESSPRHVPADRQSSKKTRNSVMGKLGWTAIAILCAAWFADHYYNSGYFTEGALKMLREIRHAFGW